MLLEQRQTSINFNSNTAAKDCISFRDEALLSRELTVEKIRFYTQRLHGILQMQESYCLDQLTTLSNQLQDTLLEQQTQLEKAVYAREAVLKFTELLMSGEVPSVHSANFVRKVISLGDQIPPHVRFQGLSPVNFYGCHVERSIEDMLFDCISIDVNCSSRTPPESTQVRRECSDEYLIQFNNEDSARIERADGNLEANSASHEFESVEAMDMKDMAKDSSVGEISTCSNAQTFTSVPIKEAIATTGSIIADRGPLKTVTVDVISKISGDDETKFDQEGTKKMQVYEEISKKKIVKKSDCDKIVICKDMTDEQVACQEETPPNEKTAPSPQSLTPKTKRMSAVDLITNSSICMEPLPEVFSPLKKDLDEVCIDNTQSSDSLTKNNENQYSPNFELGKSTIKGDQLLAAIECAPKLGLVKSAGNDETELLVEIESLPKDESRDSDRKEETELLLVKIDDENASHHMYSCDKLSLELLSPMRKNLHEVCIDDAMIDLIGSSLTKGNLINSSSKIKSEESGIENELLFDIMQSSPKRKSESFARIGDINASLQVTRDDADMQLDLTYNERNERTTKRIIKTDLESDNLPLKDVCCEISLAASSKDTISDPTKDLLLPENFAPTFPIEPDEILSLATNGSLISQKDENENFAHVKCKEAILSQSEQHIKDGNLWSLLGARPKEQKSKNISREEVCLDPILSSPIQRSTSSHSLPSEVSNTTSASLSKSTTLMMEEHVRVTFVKSPSLFYVQRSVDSEKILNLGRRLNQSARQSAQPRELIPFVGKLYLGRFTEDGKWYRALVTAINPEEKEAVVKYVDYGNSETLKTARLRKCPWEYQLDQLPSFSLMCSLWEIRPARGDSWDSEGIKTFVDLVREIALQLYVIDHEIVDGHSKCLVDLRRPGRTIGLTNDLPVSIREVLIFLEYAVYVNESPQDVYSKSITPVSKYYSPEIPFGSEGTEVLLSAVVTPHDFHLQLKSNNEYLEGLMGELQQHYMLPKVASSSDWQIYAPKVGMICVAKYSGSKMWYRAIIEDLPGCKKVDVFYVDFGNRERLWYKQIKKIADKFIILPAQAIHCYMSGIRPWGDTWDTGIANVMSSISECQDLIAFFDTLENKKCSVRLSLLAGEYDIDFADQLIHMGSAKKSYKKSSRSSSNSSHSLSSPDVGGNDVEVSKKCKKSVKKRAKKLALAKPEHVKVTYLGANSPSCIHLRLCEDVSNFDTFQSNLDTEMRNKDLQVGENVSFGDICVIKQKNAFTRVRILQIVEPNVEVHLIDCGGIQKIPMSDLHAVPDGFADQKDFSVTVTLTGIAPPGGKSHWPGISADYLQEVLMAKNELRLKQVGEPRRHQKYDIDVIPVSLEFIQEKFGGPFEGNCALYFSISDLLIQEGLALPVKDAIQDDDFGLEEDASLLLQPLSISEEQDSLEDLGEISSSEEIAVKTFDDWLPCPLPGAIEFTANPSYVDEKGVLYLQPSWNSRTLDMIKEGQTIQFTNSSPSDSDLCWGIGDPVIAKFFMDNKWYRATVLKLLANGRVFVRFVDYGNTDTVPLSDLRSNIAYDQIPIQCYKAVLHATEPRNLGNHWETKVLDFLHKTIVEKECIVTVMEKPRAGNPLQIHLVVKEHNIDVISLLVDKLKVCRRVKRNVELEDDDDSCDVIIESESYLADFPLVCLPTFRLPATPSEKLYVKVTAINDPAHVYISPVQDLKNEPSGVPYQEQLNADLAAYLEFTTFVNKDPTAFKKVENPKIGVIYLGMFSTQWFRVQILEKNSSQVKVLFVDTGYVEDISQDQLLECPEIGKNIPAMCIGVKLHSVHPALGADKPWSEEAMTAMIDCLLGSEEKDFMATAVVPGNPSEVELYRKDSDALAYCEVANCGLITIANSKHE